ncbi:MAG: porin [Pseudomonadota bacterium]
MKKALLATAIAAATGAMSVAHAESSLTGSLRYGINANDDSTTLQNFGSRIKMSGSNDAGVFGKLELRLSDSRNGNVVNRTYAVGMKGDWGQVSLGVIDPAFDKAGNRDLTWWNGGFGQLGSAEANGGIRYDGSAGAVSFAVSAHLFSDANNEDVDRVDGAIVYSAGALTLGAAVASNTGGAANNDGSKTAVTGAYKFDGGQIRLVVGSQDADFDGSAGDTDAFNVQVAFGDVYAWIGSTEEDGTDYTREGVGIGYTQSLSDRALIWYELFSQDGATAADEDVTALNAALKFDF